MKYLPLVCVFILGLISCGANEKMKQLDLNTYGIPLSILAPDSTDVIVKDLVVMKDVVIRQGDGSNFNIQLYMSDATNTDATKVASDYKADQEKDTYFSEFVSEDPQGFIFKSRIDTSTINYGFKYVRIEDGKEFLFQNGLFGNFTLEEIQKMYTAVKGSDQQ